MTVFRKPNQTLPTLRRSVLLDYNQDGRAGQPRGAATRPPTMQSTHPEGVGIAAMTACNECSALLTVGELRNVAVRAGRSWLRLLHQRGTQCLTVLNDGALVQCGRHDSLPAGSASFSIKQASVSACAADGVERKAAATAGLRSGALQCRWWDPLYSWCAPVRARDSTPPIDSSL